MRILKILLLLAPMALVGMVLYLFFYEVLEHSSAETPIMVYVYLSLAFVTATVNIVYHIVSFQFYRPKEKVNLNKKVPKILWIGGICFACFLLFVCGSAMYSILRFIRYGVEIKQIIFVSGFLVIGLLSFLELSLLKKRIKRLRKEQETKDNIETIGS